MKLLTSKKHHIYRFITVFIFVISFYINANKSLAGGGDGTQSTINTTTVDSSVNPSTTDNPNSITVTPTTLLQTGNNNYANVNSNIGTLNYPNCEGTCAFAIMRTTPANNINGRTTNQIEGIIGVIHSFSSPEQTNSQSNRQLVTIQQQRSESEISSNYIKIIADACQNKDIIRAELTAKALARIWQVDYQTLLRPNCS